MDTARRDKKSLGPSRGKVFINFGCLIHFACQLLLLFCRCRLLAVVCSKDASVSMSMWQPYTKRTHPSKWSGTKRSKWKSQRVNEWMHEKDQDSKGEGGGGWNWNGDYKGVTQRADNSNVIYKSTRLICYLCRSRPSPSPFPAASASGWESRIPRWGKGAGGAVCWSWRCWWSWWFSKLVGPGFWLEGAAKEMREIWLTSTKPECPNKNKMQ